MDRKQIIDHLTLCERHIKRGEEHIAGQIELIARLEDHGHDTTEARRLLGEFQQLLEVDLATRDRLRGQLALETQE